MLRLAKIAALISAVVLLNAVTTLLFVQSRVPAAAQVGPAQCVDGDVNGDAGLNIGDPIYLLQHLFQGGPGPVACAQGPTPSELESVLAKFFPRHADRWDSGHLYLAPLQQANVLVVPPGRVFTLKTIWNSPGAVLNNVAINRNTEDITQVASYLHLDGGTGAITGRTNLPELCFEAGDVLSVTNTNLTDGRFVWLFGYLTDAP